MKKKMKLEPLAFSFTKLLLNNKDKDWNDLIFRETMANAFRYCVDKRIEWLKSRFDDLNIGCCDDACIACLKDYRALIDLAFPDLIHVSHKTRGKE